MCQNLRTLTSDAPCLRVDLPAVSIPVDSGTVAPPVQKDSAPPSSAEPVDVHMAVASPTQSPGAMAVDSAPPPRKWTFSFGGAYCRVSSEAYKATQPGGLCVFVVYYVDLSPVKEGPELDVCISAVGEEVEDPVRCRFLVTRSAENRFKVVYPTETNVDYSDYACGMIIAVNEARDRLGLPSLVLYTEEQLEPSTVGQWKIDEVEPHSKGSGPKAIAGVLRFTGDETVYAPLRIEGYSCELLAVKGGLVLPLFTGLASLPAVSDRGFPLPGRGYCVRGNLEDRPDDSSTRVPDDPDDRSPVSEDFGPHWSRVEFYKDFGKKSVYELRT